MFFAVPMSLGFFSADVRHNPRGWDHRSDHAPVMIELDLPYETGGSP